MRGGSIDRRGFAPRVGVRRVLLPYDLVRPGELRADAPSSPLLCGLRRQYTRVVVRTRAVPHATPRGKRLILPHAVAAKLSDEWR